MTHYRFAMNVVKWKGVGVIVTTSIIIHVIDKRISYDI